MKSRTFKAHGRIEIGGNHTDHQHGLVLAAAIELQIWCTVTPNNDNIVNIKSSKFSDFSVNLNHLEVIGDEKKSPAALVRGVAAWLKKHEHKIGGFDATVSSNLPAGAGLSSSAAFEVLIGNIFKGLYCPKVTPMEIALAGRYAENEYYGKPCGLMDQVASAYGGLNMIDFSDPDNVVVTPIKETFSDYLICITDTGTSHADLIPKYAAIPHEMLIVAGHFGADFLQEVDPEVFYARIGKLRTSGLSDRAILRAIHFFEENLRVKKQAEALNAGRIKEFLELVNASGRSSMAYLQNVFSASDNYRQSLTLALALSEKILNGKGAWRVHGGGFAGSILAIMPGIMKSDYERQICKVFGESACHFLSICADGGGEFNN